MNKKRFKIIPADVLTGAYVPGERLLAMWQWFVQRLRDAGPDANGYVPYEFINGTSSIHNTEPYPIDGDAEGWNEKSWQDKVRRRLSQLLKRAGHDCFRECEFLREHCNLRDWKSLARPMWIGVRTDEAFPDPAWFAIEGRTFRISPNECHKKATFAQRGELLLDRSGKLWGYQVVYGYPHDSSSWHWRIWQKPGQSLAEFTAEVNRAISDAMTPDPDPRGRTYQEREWWRIHGALNDVFHWGTAPASWEETLADALIGIEGGAMRVGRIAMSPERLRTLKAWVTADRRKEAQRVARLAAGKAMEVQP
jgi:hypothetical protein